MAPPGSLVGNVLTFTKGAAAIANGDATYVIETSGDLVEHPQRGPAGGISRTGLDEMYGFLDETL